MTGATETGVVRGRASTAKTVAAAAVGLSALLFALALAAGFELLSLTGRLAGVPTIPLLGGLLVTLGAAVIAFGAGSRLELVETDPSRSAGLVAGTLFTGIWFVVTGLVASQTLGLGTVGWLAAASLGGAAAFAVTALPREDVGSTVPAGALAGSVGLVMLTGGIGPDWSWSPAGFSDAQSVTVFPRVVIPIAVAFCALVVGWAAAKAYGGFGARGRHLGAYLLIYLNAGSIIAVLFVLVAFVFAKGIDPVMAGVTVGLGVGPTTTLAVDLVIPFADVRLFGLSYDVVWPVSWPFVMNGASILNDVNGVWPAIVGTIWLVVGAVALAVPLGVGSAIFLTEYAERGRFTQVVEVATNALWSTPSIVFGLFGAAFLLPRFTPTPKKSLLAGMITLGFMLLPLVLITAREAMLSVPDEYRDASAALGVSKWQTVRSVVLPAAMPGVVTGVILGVGRIAGETAPLILTMGGGTFVTVDQAASVVDSFQLTLSPPFVTNPELTQATTALPYQLYQLILANVGQSSGIENMDTFRWGTALVLLVVVLSFYAIGIATRQYFRRKLDYE
ncbi:phosphate ABC transporter permease PstA [Halorussus litoreus]|uniref:phosphate ABC transporter permease PstA n=1 Tax=Halorussus litoreus TaxID=1710536 RepID=UPI000E2309F8|nr:phosphate ABC transporter permease PstA [Halorussus litoreus]